MKVNRVTLGSSVQKVEPPIYILLRTRWTFIYPEGTAMSELLHLEQRLAEVVHLVKELHKEVLANQ